MQMFRKEGDYAAFERVVAEACQRHPMRILSYCIMPNHWHLLLWPRKDGELSRFMFWMTMTHTQRWRHARGLVGLGPLYQGRFKAFPVQDDQHLLIVTRYIERNALRANLAQRAEQWPHCSLYARARSQASLAPLLCDGPVPMPADYIAWVNRPQTAAEEDAVRTSLRRNRPLGDLAWATRTAQRLGLESCFRERGRPKKPSKETK